MSTVTGAARESCGTYQKSSLTIRRAMLVVSGRFLCAIMAGTLIASCATNVLLRRPPDAETGHLGALIRCEADDKPCRQETTYDSSVFNLSGTTFFSLPNCQYGIRELLIRHAGSPNAFVIVRCAAPRPTQGNGLPVTAPGGGTTPSQ
jgi:hypothetical protein